jgi:hypothetical protein
VALLASGQRFDDVCLDPIDQFQVLRLSFANPRRQILQGFMDVA